MLFWKPPLDPVWTAPPLNSSINGVWGPVWTLVTGLMSFPVVMDLSVSSSHGMEMISTAVTPSAVWSCPGWWDFIYATFCSLFFGCLLWHLCSCLCQGNDAYCTAAKKMSKSPLWTSDTHVCLSVGVFLRWALDLCWSSRMNDHPAVVLLGNHKHPTSILKHHNTESSFNMFALHLAWHHLVKSNLFLKKWDIPKKHDIAQKLLFWRAHVMTTYICESHDVKTSHHLL